MKRQKKHTHHKTVGKKRRSGQKHVAPRTAAELFAQPKEFQDTWNNAVHVVSKMRADRVSLRSASREVGIDPRTVVQLVGSALRKRLNRSYAATTRDRLLRVITIPDRKKDLREVATRDSREASIASRYLHAVHVYVRFGDKAPLEEFPRTFVRDAKGKRITLLMDFEALDRLASAEVLSFETIYAKR